MLLRGFRSNLLHQIVRDGRRLSSSMTGSSAAEQRDSDQDGKPFGMEPGDRPFDWRKKTLLVFYFGGLAAFLFLYQYVPDTSYRCHQTYACD